MLLKLLVVVANLNSAFAFDIAEFVDTLEKNKINTVEDAIPFLPADSFSNFTFMYQSGGLQEETSFQNPRAILFNQDAKFVASFSMHESKDPVSKSIEILQYNTEKAEFELFDLAFPIKKDENDDYIVPPKNPVLCLKCHSQDPRPIWGAVNDWRGAYGSQDDHLIGREAEEYLKFRNLAHANPRYTHLNFGSSLFSPYWNEGKPSVISRPNMRFGILANRLNRHRVRRIVDSSSLYQKYRWVILGGASCNTNLNKAEENWTLEDGQKLYAMLREDITAQNGGLIPYPQYSLLNIFNLTNLDPADLNLASSDPKNVDPFAVSWYDGTASSGSFVFFDLLQVLSAEDPRIANIVRRVSTRGAIQLFGLQHLMEGEFAQNFFDLVEALGGDFIIGSLTTKPECLIVKDNIRKSLGITPTHLE